MGLRVHSLGEIPTGAARAHYVYSLDYGWEEALGNPRGVVTFDNSYAHC